MFLVPTMQLTAIPWMGSVAFGLFAMVSLVQARREVMLGIRPEDLRVVPNGELRAVVELVSPQGSEQYVNTRIGGVEIIEASLSNHREAVIDGALFG